MIACILTFYPSGERHTGCRNIFGREIRAIHIDVTVVCWSTRAIEFGSSIALASGLCCDVAIDSTVMAVAGLVHDNFTNIVKRIVYDQRRIVGKTS